MEGPVNEKGLLRVERYYPSTASIPWRRNETNVIKRVGGKKFQDI